MVVKLPDKIGKYQVVELIGSGASGIVYKARHPEIGRQVAVKVLKANSNSEGFQERLVRFRNEAKIAGNLKHPSIVTIYDVDLTEGQPFIVMDLVEGEVLSSLLQSNSTLPLSLALYYFEQISSGLSTAHESGVLHKDIKPDNIVVDSDNQVFILDFGVSQFLSKKSSNNQEQDKVFGTPAYMSSEQFLNSEVDQRSDLFSLAVVTYELLTGSRPFEGESVKEILNNILTKTEISFPKRLNFPIDLDFVFTKALAREPERRYSSIVEFHKALLDCFGLSRAEKPTEDREFYFPNRPWKTDSEKEKWIKSKRLNSSSGSLKEISKRYSSESVKPKEKKWKWPVLFLVLSLLIIALFWFLIFPPPKSQQIVVDVPKEKVVAELSNQELKSLLNSGKINSEKRLELLNLAESRNLDLIYILPLLDDFNPRVRMKVIKLIEKHGDDRVELLIKKRLEVEEDFEVKLALENVLSVLTGMQ